MSDNPNEGNQYDQPNQEVVGVDIVLEHEAQPITDEPETEPDETEPEVDPETEPVEPEEPENE